MLFTLIVLLIAFVPSLTYDQLRSKSVSLQQNCAVDVTQRKDCGYTGITKTICVSTNGCCWAQPPTGVSAPWCFYSGTDSPTPSPTYSPTASPTTASPTVQPSTSKPTTLSPTSDPSTNPTMTPTNTPSFLPTLTPSLQPSITPTVTPTLLPSTFSPSRIPTSMRPLTLNPSFAPTVVANTDSSSGSDGGNSTVIMTSIIIVGLIVLGALAFVAYSFCHIYGYGHHQPPVKEEKKALPPIDISEFKDQGHNYASFYSVSDKFKFNRRDLMLYHTETEDSIDDFDTDFKSIKWYSSKDHEFSN